MLIVHVEGACSDQLADLVVVGKRRAVINHCVTLLVLHEYLLDLVRGLRT